jgi:uncharacterized delta-60 repeat protein
MKLFTAKQFGLILPGIFLALMSVLNVFGATGDVDPGFDPKLTIDLTGNFPGSPATQPDGKIIIFGYYQLSGFSHRPYLRRLNADGTNDPTFACPECHSFFPTSVLVRPDGKLMVIGTTAVFSGNHRLIRVNQNGSLDTSFQTPFENPAVPCEPLDVAAQADGKSLIRCKINLTSGSQQEIVRRLNDNGSLDTSFATIALTVSPRQSVVKMVSQPDGKVLLGGEFPSSGAGWIKRHNSDGSLDSSFQTTVSARIVGFDILSDGKYLIVGWFSTVNGSSRPKIARLFSNGSLDTGFTAPTANNEVVTGLKLLPNGQFYIRLYVDPVPLPGGFVGRFVRFNADGSVDNTFNQTFLQPGAWAVDEQNCIVVYRDRFYRLNIDGSIDQSFNLVISVDGFNVAAALQSDGKIVIAGEFQKTNGANTVRFSRVNSDGTTDSTFSSGTGFDVAPTVVAVQPDVKILASGPFTVYNGAPRTKLVRINADGSLDAAFNPTFSPSTSDTKIFSIVPLPTGKILIGGNFTAVNGTNQIGFARLNADGSLDAAFHPGFGNLTAVFSILVQTDGKIMVGGSLTGDDVVRLNSDGSVDNSFDDNSVLDARQVFQRADGKYIVSTNNFVSPSTIVLLDNNGTRDFGFNFLSNCCLVTDLNSILVQPNGNIVIGGTFGFINGRNSRNIARFGPFGQSDIYFPTIGAIDSVNTLLGQPDGKIIFVGNFSGIEDAPRTGIARLTLSNRIRGTLFDYDGDGRADLSVFRPSTNSWYELLSSNGELGFQGFGANGDVVAPADYDGDGRTDVGLFRPSTGEWFYILSSTNTVIQRQWGQAGDVPLPADVTGDGKAELIVYRPTTGTWFRTGGGDLVFGDPGDKPLIGDFDGDGRVDPAIFRPSTGVWWYWASSAAGQHRAFAWGSSTDIPAPGDYDGDGKTDYAVYRPSEGGWYIFNSGSSTATGVQFGLAGDKPVPADYDGDGKTDIAVFRPSNGVWYSLQSSAGFGGLQWGVATDIPTENAYIPH